MQLLCMKVLPVHRTIRQGNFSCIIVDDTGQRFINEDVYRRLGAILDRPDRRYYLIIDSRH